MLFQYNNGFLFQVFVLSILSTDSLSCIYNTKCEKQKLEKDPFVL